MKTLVLMLLLAAASVGILASLAPERASSNPQGPCIIRCFEGHCERCCKERGQWVCS